MRCVCLFGLFRASENSGVCVLHKAPAHEIFKYLNNFVLPLVVAVSWHDTMPFVLCRFRRRRLCVYVLGKLDAIRWLAAGGGRQWTPPPRNDYAFMINELCAHERLNNAH